MNIAELSRRAELPVRTVRYYADRDLIRPTGRTAGGYRIFDDGALRRLRFIRRTQALGLPLREILVLLRAAERQSCGESSRLVVHRLKEQLSAVEQRIAELEAIQHELGSLVVGQSGGCSDELCLCNVEPAADSERSAPRLAQRR